MIARPVSQPNVDVAEGEEEESVKVPEHRVAWDELQSGCRHRTAPANVPRLNGQNHMFSRKPNTYAETAPYDGQHAISTRPLHAGSNPAPRPTHDAASIWNGQPRTDASGEQRRGEQRRRAEDESESRPVDTPGEDQQEEHRLDARGARCRAVAAPHRRPTAGRASRSPSHRAHRCSNSASTTAITSGRISTKTNGASA